MNQQIDLFESVLPSFKIGNRKIYLVELFGGIGSQASSLERLHANFEHWRLVELDKFACASYNAVHGTHFEPQDICQIHAKDLEIPKDSDAIALWTYSFPCQDLTNANAKAKGMKRDSGSRSGLLWQVERLLNECDDNLPDVLVMENVKNIVGKHIDDFQEWELFLNRKGYKNYVQVLDACDFGIPQHRERCIMVSIRGDYYYEFPKKQELHLKVKDLLDENVDESYFLSDKMIKYVLTRPKNFRCPDAIINRDIARTLNTKKGVYRAGVETYVSDVLPDNFNCSKWTLLQAMMIDENGNVKRYIDSDETFEFKEGQIADISFPNGYGKRGSRVHDICPTINIATTKNSFIVKIQDFLRGLRIRKLTSRECWSLMGFLKEDFDKASKVCKEAQLYKQAGNSIVVNVLMAVFNQML